MSSSTLGIAIRVFSGLYKGFGLSTLARTRRLARVSKLHVGCQLSQALDAGDIDSRRKSGQPKSQGNKRLNFQITTQL